MPDVIHSAGEKSTFTFFLAECSQCSFGIFEETIFGKEEFLNTFFQNKSSFADSNTKKEDKDCHSRLEKHPNP
jgi:hypothetical protein